MKLWWHELHQITGAMALAWAPTAATLRSWADRLIIVAVQMNSEANKKDKQ